MPPTYIKELADAVGQIAEDIQGGDAPCQNLRSAIHSVNMMLMLELCKRMEKLNQ